MAHREFPLSGSSGAGDVVAADAKSDGPKNASMWPKEGSVNGVRK